MFWKGLHLKQAEQSALIVVQFVQVMLSWGCYLQAKLTAIMGTLFPCEWGIVFNRIHSSHWQFTSEQHKPSWLQCSWWASESSVEGAELSPTRSKAALTFMDEEARGLLGCPSQWNYRQGGRYRSVSYTDEQREMPSWLADRNIPQYTSHWPKLNEHQLRITVSAPADSADVSSTWIPPTFCCFTLTNVFISIVVHRCLSH